MDKPVMKVVRNNRLKTLWKFTTKHLAGIVLSVTTIILFFCHSHPLLIFLMTIWSIAAFAHVEIEEKEKLRKDSQSIRELKSLG